MQTIDNLRTEIWDHLYRSGPQTVEQLAGSFSVDAITVTSVVEHEWFEMMDFKVQIATGKPPAPPQGFVG